MPKEQYEELTAQGKTMFEIVSMVSPQDKKIKEVCLMSENVMDKILDISADKLIKQDFEEKC